MSTTNSIDAEPGDITSSISLPPSDCAVQYRFADADERVSMREVVMADGSIVTDFDPQSAAQIVQQCFYEEGLTPDDETALLLAERVLWTGSPMTAARTAEPDAYLFDKYGVTWSPPTIERTEDGFVASFYAVEYDLTLLMHVQATVTPESVDYVVEELGNPRSTSSG